jgi:mRNA interferase MazF
MESQDFDRWNNNKKGLEKHSPVFENFPHRAEVWMVVLGKNLGSEQNGAGSNFSRPVLVFKKFNNQMFWCIPLSTKQKYLDYYFNFKDPFNQKVAAIIAQMRLLSIKRFQRKMYTLEWSLFDKLKATAVGIIG